jgi:hypothetical protein
MFVRDGDVGIGREAAKYVHSLWRRGVSRVAAFRVCCEYDERRATRAHHNLWEWTADFNIGNSWRSC